MENPKILLAEDDADFGNMLKQYLTIQKYEVTHAKHGAEAWDFFIRNKFDIAILDVMMPELDGLNLAKKIKAKAPSFPLIFLTAKSLREDKIAGLEIGADDYITKPFDPDELMLRLRNILKRVDVNTDSTIELSNSSLKYATLELTCMGHKRVITPKEMDLLSYLFKNPNKVIARDKLLKDLWGESDYFIGRSMDVFMTKIRKHISKDKALKLKTIRGRGYILELDER